MLVNCLGLNHAAALVAMEDHEAPTEETAAREEEEEVACLQIWSWIGGRLVKKTWADTGVVVEHINPDFVKMLKLQFLKWDEYTNGLCSLLIQEKNWGGTIHLSPGQSCRHCGCRRYTRSSFERYYS